jgi:hypothetical protein
MPHAGICAGGVGKPASLPRPHVPPAWKGGMHWLQQQWSLAKKRVHGLYARCRPRGLCWVLFTQEDIAPLTRGFVLEEGGAHERARER